MAPEGGAGELIEQITKITDSNGVEYALEEPVSIYLDHLPLSQIGDGKFGGVRSTNVPSVPGDNTN